jgi:starch synthase
MTKKIKVLFTASELSPIAKVGGLADVMGALPKALEKLGVDVRIVIPKYGSIDAAKYGLKKIIDEIEIPFNHASEKAALFEAPLPGSTVPIYFIDNNNYLGQGGVYFEADGSSSGLSREAERFTFLSRACLSIFEPLDWYPDVIHCHDWHVGFVPLLLKILSKQSPKLSGIKTVFSIHNLEYQGRYNAKRICDLLGITESDYPTLSVQRDGDLISVQQAILISDYVSTVSPNYAREILTPEYGAGLNNDLEKRRNELLGILNGIDVDHFDPATDKNIAAMFTAQDITGKKTCKADLQKSCGLAVNKNIPIFGIVSRLAEQKGLELVAEIADGLTKKGAQLVLLGTGLPPLEAMMKKMAENHPNTIRCTIAFDAVFAQKVYAGSDMFLMPSKFEPCGLGQMIAMRYGTIPIVRATGGLKDTVTDFNEHTGGDGFVFTDYSADALMKAADRALELFSNQEMWHTIIKRVMQKDFSWNQSARQYIDMYHKTIN